jgi:hypothetical protein
LGLDSIWIDEGDLVHFYQFKNPEDPIKGIPAGDVDKTISGLRLILNRKHDGIANAELKPRAVLCYRQTFRSLVCCLKHCLNNMFVADEAFVVFKYVNNAG